MRGPSPGSPKCWAPCADPSAAGAAPVRPPAGQLRRQIRNLQTHDCQLLLQRRVADEQIETAPFESLAQFTGVVAGQDNDRAGVWLSGCPTPARSPESRSTPPAKRPRIRIRAVDSSISNTTGSSLRIARSRGRCNRKRIEKKTSSSSVSGPRLQPENEAPARVCLQLLPQQLCVEELLGILPFLERLSFRPALRSTASG